MPKADSPQEPDFPDVYYAVTAVPKTYSYLAARKATLFQFVSISRGFEYAEGYMRVWWRALLSGLYTAARDHPVSYPDLSAKKVQFLRNCPPACSVPQKTARICDRVYFCPYCRGRLASETYKGFLAYAFPHGQVTTVDMYLLVVEQRVSRSGSWEKTAFGASDLFRSYDVDTVVRRSRAEAAVVYKQPYLDHERDSLCFRYAMVLFGRDLRLDVVVCDNSEFVENRDLTRGKLCNAASVLTAYPFVQFSDAMTVVELLDLYAAVTHLTKRHRLFRTYGGYREKK